jgi:GNAT superfamily N-acetyltransferase
MFANEASIELEDLFVDPDWMRHGVGLAMVADVVGIARAHGERRFDVTANLHALEFYRAAGFVHDATTDTPFGPALRMHLDIAP